MFPPLRLALLAALALAAATQAATVPQPAPVPAVAPATPPPPRAVPPAAPTPASKQAPNTTDESSVAVCTQVKAWDYTDVPVVVIRTAGAPTRATNVSSSHSHVTVCRPDGAVDWAGKAKVRVRGGTNTQRWNKIIQYAVTGLPRVTILGMPAAKQLILLGQQNDTLSIKTWMGLELARVMPPPSNGSAAPPPLGWTPLTRHVEVFLVTGDAPLTPAAYQGARLLTQHIEKGKNRVPLRAQGWLATYLHGEPDPEGTEVALPVSHKTWMVKSPQKAKMDAATLAAAKAAFTDFETAVLASPIGDWRKVANEAAAVDWFVLAELVKTTKHTYHSASFAHALGGGDPSLRFGPIWATTQGFGTCCGYPVDGFMDGGASTGASGGSGISPNGWLFSICTREPDRCRVLDGYDKGNGFAPWFDALFFNDPTFATTAAARYRSLRAGPWSDAAVTATLADKRKDIGGAGPRTLARWEAELAKPWLGGGDGQVDAAFDAVGAWLTARLRWLDGAWAQAADAGTRRGAYKEAY